MVAILLREDSVSAPSTPPDIKYPSLSSFSTYTAAQDTYDGSADIAYIAAEFSDSLFPSNGYYIIGEETEPNDRSSTYTNGQLRYGTPYTFFLRAYPYLVSSCMHYCTSACVYSFSRLLVVSVIRSRLQALKDNMKSSPLVTILQ